jgi:branched-chain amino acid aminotransferase
MKHMERLSNSARRLKMPELDPKLATDWLLEFVRNELDCVPSGPGTSLYLRPTMIAKEPFLGVRPARSYLLFVVGSPVASYFAGDAPLKVRVEDSYARAALGGVGATKTGGNYASSLLPTEEARAAGFDEVLWLDAKGRCYLEEIGTMNIMLRIGDEVLTPPLSGTILPGIIRDSALTLLRDWGISVRERPIDVFEVLSAARNGVLREAWGTGTAAGIVAIGELGYRGERLLVGDSRPGEITMRLAGGLADLQQGRAPDRHGWMNEV